MFRNNLKYNSLPAPWDKGCFLFADDTMISAGGAAGGGGAYSVTNAVTFESGDSQKLTRTPGSTADGDRKCTISVWVKLHSPDQSNYIIAQARIGAAGSDAFLVVIDNSDKLNVVCETDAGAKTIHRISNRLFRDYHGWYHFHIQIDGSQTDDTSCTVTINGVEYTDWGTKVNPSASTDLDLMNTTRAVGIGTDRAGSSYSDISFAQFAYLDNILSAATNFGEFDNNGVWRPIDITGLTYGSEGRLLTFENGDALGLDTSQTSSTAATVSFAGSTVDTSNTTNYTFSSHAIGTADASRFVVVIVSSSRATGGARTVSSMTIGGQSAALMVRQTSDNGDCNEIWGALVTTGTTGDIVVNHSSSMGSCGIGVFATYNADQNYFFTASTEGTTSSATVVIPENAICIAGHRVTDNLNATTWTNITEAYDENIEDNDHTGGSTSTDGTTTITATNAAPHADDTMVIAVLFPADAANHFTSSGLTSADQSNNTPTEQFITWSSINLEGATEVITNGGLSHAGSTGTNGWAGSTMAIYPGEKKYFEMITGGGSQSCGIQDQSQKITGSPLINCTYINTGSKMLNNVITAYGASYTTETIGVAVNTVDDEVEFFKDNASQGTISIDSGITWILGSQRDGGSVTWTLNNGSIEAPFEFTPPTGFTAISTSNALTPSITDPSAHFQTHLFTGTGAENAITLGGNSTFQPGLVWIKDRTTTSNHVLVDEVRTATQELIITNSTESTAAQGVKSFNSAGVTLGTDTDYNNTNAMLMYTWKGSASSGSANSDGTISSTVSANDDGGFSIVKWTGTGSAGTVGHGLSAAPKMIIVKGYSDAHHWRVLHMDWATDAETDNILWNTTAAKTDSATIWNDTAPTSTVFSVGTDGGVNLSAENHIAYCFRDIPGFLKTGIYYGSANATYGPCINLGFRPAFIMIKSATTADNWLVFDDQRDGYNPDNDAILPNSTNGEGTDDHIDILSNGFKCRGTVSPNAAQTYFYIAFAKNAPGSSTTSPPPAR